MWMLPDLDYLRQYINYTDMFVLTIIWNITIYGIFIAAAFLGFLIYKIYRIKLK